jgi:hypothetical protein
VALTLTVTDSKGLQGRVTFNVNVNSGKGDAAVNASLNTWPQVSNLSASTTALELNESTTVSVTASDNDGDTLAYNWTASCPGTWSNATSATAQFTATALPASNVCNNCNLTVTVTDFRNNQPIGGQTTGTLSLCVGPRRTAVFPPDITETFQSSASTAANGTLTFRVKAVDPQGSAMSFSWAATTGTAGTPTTSTNASEVVWTAPACVSSATPPSITVTVSNTLGASTAHSFTVTGLPACASGWGSASPMPQPRSNHTATLLPSGKVLITGGVEAGTVAASAALYDPASGTWSAAASMPATRESHSATLLPNGKVLVAGGYNGSYHADAWLYDPGLGTWSTTVPLTSARGYHTATLLNNGKVLFSRLGWGSPLPMELYDPASGTWSTVASMPTGRYEHTATLLNNGKVLFAGGYINGNGSASTVVAELYDPASGTWSAAAPMASVRAGHTATLLNNGQVLVLGGSNGSLLSSAALYTP